jgi:hypothetical protein
MQLSDILQLNLTHPDVLRENLKNKDTNGYGSEVNTTDTQAEEKADPLRDLLKSTQERFNNYDAEKDGDFFKVLDEIYKKPKPLDENALGRRAMFSAIGDSVKLLGQMYAASKGARIRDINNTLTDQNLSREDKERNVYLEQLERYKRLRENAMMSHLNSKEGKKNALQNEINTLTLKIDERERTAAAAERKQANDDRTFEHKVQNDNLLYNLKKEDINAKRAGGYYTKRSGTGGTTKGQGKNVSLRWKNGDMVDVPETIWKTVFPDLVNALIEKKAEIPASWKPSGTFEEKPGKFPSLSEQQAFVLKNIELLPPKYRKWLKELATGSGATVLEDENTTSETETEASAAVENSNKPNNKGGAY